ncbi:hypothetical protein [Streptomyces sp. 3214.6]|uniref:hypothetical protein n=1 Tax=Streptomyces sp. 3214.6 TaxID=1882757 RepID=UPI0009099254|nr:hypothetical protein [Streptomyces sp. 3214.6]SHI65804.1 hypothetical protein SAMN05444521_8158 [Streptomyces sp. 3214.6]
MIAYAFLILGCGGTAVVVYAIAPAGRGLHRYVAPRSKLRAEAARAAGQVEELACKLAAVTSELEAVTVDRDGLRANLGKAEQLVKDAEDEAKQLRETNRSLRAALSNATAIRPLTPVKAIAPPPSPVPSSVAVPLHMAPIAHSPAAEPS